MEVPLSPYRLAKARELYNIFNIFNALSWQFLVGNVITLFALSMGATSAYIGTLSAVLYVSFFFLPLGRILTRHFSVVKIFSVAWILRCVVMLPVFFAPFVYVSGRHDTALILVLSGVTLFHVTRGVGMIGNNPILSFLATGSDRGSYLTQVQIVTSAGSMFAGFVIALILGRNPPLFLYAIIVGSGIASGIFAGIVMFKIPGPALQSDVRHDGFATILRDVFSQLSMRRFIVILMLVALASGVSRTFVVVYSREVFLQSDGMVSLYAVFGGFGVLLAGFVIKFLVDKIGAKPIFSLYVIIGLVSMIPIIFFPLAEIENHTTSVLYLTFLFFMMSFGWLGSEAVMQTYFLGMVSSEKVMDMGIVYFLGFGIAGAGGTFLSGVLLDLLTALSGSMSASFRILYAMLVLIAVLILFLMRNLVSLGALPFKGAMEVMFSFRELKAISLIDKLNKTSDSGEEAAILSVLHGTPSTVATKGLLKRAQSPRLSVRMDSIRAINALKVLSEDAEAALMNDIINNPYTTAYISARALGNHGVFRAMPLLRELSESSDYMLAGEAIIALAKLGDHSFRLRIEEIIAETQNPRLKIMGAEALGIYGSPDSLPVLLGLQRRANPPPYLRDGIVLALASILRMQNRFYPLLLRLLADLSQAPVLAEDEVESAYEHYMTVHGRKRSNEPKLSVVSKQAKTLQSAVAEYMHNDKGDDLARWILELPDDLVNSTAQTILSETVLDKDFLDCPRLKLLIVHWTAQQLKAWTNKLKG